MREDGYYLYAQNTDRKEWHHIFIGGYHNVFKAVVLRTVTNIDSSLVDLSILCSHLRLVKTMFQRGYVNLGEYQLSGWLSSPRYTTGNLGLLRFLYEHYSEYIYEPSLKLMYAVAQKSLPVVKLLISHHHGPDIILTSDVIERAIIVGNIKILKYLVQQGADITVGITENSLTSMAHRNHTHTLKYIRTQVGNGVFKQVINRVTMRHRVTITQFLVKSK